MQQDKCVILLWLTHLLSTFVRYNDHPFHNFEHASHVTMSVTKLLARVVVTPDESHRYLQGTTSDALTQFAVLSEEGAPVAKLYNHRSVAENNSIAVAWDYFMLDEFKNLRSCICPNESERKRFQDLVVNTVLATDIVDKGLKDARNARWELVFGEDASSGDPSIDMNRAKIVLEHLIQASDVA